MPGETVPPSPEPDAAAGTGTGGSKDAAPPPPSESSAGTGGLGTVADQQGGSAQGDAPYDLSEDGPRDHEQPPQSPSGT
jgi:hypothetical protein